MDHTKIRETTFSTCTDHTRITRTTFSTCTDHARRWTLVVLPQMRSVCADHTTVRQILDGHGVAASSEDLYKWCLNHTKIKQALVGYGAASSTVGICTNGAQTTQD